MRSEEELDMERQLRQQTNPFYDQDLDNLGVDPVIRLPPVVVPARFQRPPPIIFPSPPPRASTTSEASRALAARAVNVPTVPSSLKLTLPSRRVYRVFDEEDEDGDGIFILADRKKKNAKEDQVVLAEAPNLVPPLRFPRPPGAPLPIPPRPEKRRFENPLHLVDVDQVLYEAELRRDQRLRLPPPPRMPLPMAPVAGFALDQSVLQSLRPNVRRNLAAVQFATSTLPPVPMPPPV